MKRFEHLKEPLAPRHVFFRRLARNVVMALSVVAVSLAIGMAGYHAIAGLAWVDAFLNASMILTGMGPVDPMKSDAAKIFASCYALYSGFAVLTTAGIILAPVLHRMIHRFHAAEDS